MDTKITAHYDQMCPKGDLFIPKIYFFLSSSYPKICHQLKFTSYLGIQGHLHGPSHRVTLINNGSQL